MSDTSHPVLPKSATSLLTPMVGFAAMLLSIWILYDLEMAAFVRVVLVAGSMAIAMAAVELLVFKVHRRPSTGLDWSLRNFSWRRFLTKMAGIVGTIAILAFLYACFYEYRGSFYFPLWEAIRYVLPVAVIFTVVYVGLIDSVMVRPEDGYYHVGLLMTGQWSKMDRSRLLPYMRSCLIKAFFIPLMFVYAVDNFWALPGHLVREWWANPMMFYAFTWFVIIAIDVLFAVIGYVFCFRALDTHERWSEPTMYGWFVTIICYQPFWNFISNNYLYHGPEYYWEPLYATHPVVVSIWVALAVGLALIYCLSTIVFGMRFSNLTFRGVITTGPYRFTKHPAYIAKNISFWLISAPFIVRNDNIKEAVFHCALLLILNAIYFMRAWTEERHLARDPVYEEYRRWIAKNGTFRWVKIPSPRPLNLDIKA